MPAYLNTYETILALGAAIWTARGPRSARFLVHSARANCWWFTNRLPRGAELIG